MDEENTTTTENTTDDGEGRGVSDSQSTTPVTEYSYHYDDYYSYQPSGDITITIDHASTSISPYDNNPDSQYKTATGTYDVQALSKKNGNIYAKINIGQNGNVHSTWINVTAQLNSGKTETELFGPTASTYADSTFSGYTPLIYAESYENQANAERQNTLVNTSVVNRNSNRMIGNVMDETEEQAEEIPLDSKGDYVLWNGAKFDQDDLTTLDARVKEMFKIFGLPPQWNEYVDPPLGSAKLMGRRYGETIMSSPTILALCPGKIGYSKGLASAITGEVAYSDFLSAMTAGGLEPFWKFEEQWDMSLLGGEPGYIDYVNTMSRYAAICMSIAQQTNDYSNGGIFDLANLEVPWGGGTYAELNAGALLIPSAYETALDIGYHYVYFNANGQTSAEEQFSTETRATVIEQMINGGISDIAKDVGFISSGIIGGNNIIGNDLAALDDLTMSAFGGGLGAILSSAKEVLQGGVIAFPKVIDNCTWGRSFSFTVKFSSVYGDVESRFLNVVFPFICLACLFLPKQLKNAIDMYTYPPIVRAFARGLYACDAGVLTGISVKLGGDDENAWTASGQPMEITVQFSIKSMHENLMQSDSTLWIAKNIGLQLYVGTLCGIDMTMSSAKLMQKTLESFKKNVFHDLQRHWSNTIWRVINKNPITRTISNILSMGH